MQEDHIIFLNVVSAPEGIERVFSLYPNIKIVTCALDDCLNEDKYIVPVSSESVCNVQGLGDYGDRYFNRLDRCICYQTATPVFISNFTEKVLHITPHHYHHSQLINRHVAVIRTQHERMLANRLISLVMKISKVWMSQSLFDSDSFQWIDHQHLLQQIQAERRGLHSTASQRIP